MGIQFEFCTKMVFCFSFIVNCSKPDAPIKGPKYVSSQDSDVDNLGHWPRAIYFFDRQTDRLTDRQTNREAGICILPCLSSQTSYHCLSMDCLKTVSELYLYISIVSLPENEPYQT